MEFEVVTKDELPEVFKVKRTRPMPKKLRNSIRPDHAYDFVGTGKYRHRHLFETPDMDQDLKDATWSIVRQWKGNHWFLYQERLCIYDDCGQKQVRHLKKPYCMHCGQVKED